MGNISHRRIDLELGSHDDCRRDSALLHRNSALREIRSNSPSQHGHVADVRADGVRCDAGHVFRAALLLPEEVQELLLLLRCEFRGHRHLFSGRRFGFVHRSCVRSRVPRS